MREEAAILEKALEEIEKQSATLLNELKNLEDAPHKIVVKIKMLKKEQESYLNQFEKANRDKKEISKQIAHKQTQIDQITENKDKKESETQVAVLQAEIAALQAKLSFITRRFDDSAKEAQVIQDKINGFTQLLKNFQELESVQE
jgi:chromosome segregation ATPase